MAAKKMKLLFCWRDKNGEYFWSEENVFRSNTDDDVPDKNPDVLETSFPMPRPGVDEFSCVSSGSQIFVIGGLDPGGINSTDEVYMMDARGSSPSRYQWEKLPSTNGKRRYAAAAAVDDKIFVMGSVFQPTYYPKEVIVTPWGEFLDLKKKPWKWEAMIPPPNVLEDDLRSFGCRFLQAVDTDNNKIYVNTEGPPWNLCFDVKENAWRDDGIPITRRCNIETGRNVIVEGFYYLISSAYVAFDLNQSTGNFIQAGLEYVLDGEKYSVSGNVPENFNLEEFPKPIYLESLPPLLEKVSNGRTFYLFHLGKGDMCLVVQAFDDFDEQEFDEFEEYDANELDEPVWCQNLHISSSGVEFRSLKKYKSQGRLHDCLLVEDS